MTSKRTTSRRFVGQNVKGTPAMPAAHVRSDMRQVRKHADAFGLQEFKWPWYWRVLNVVLVASGWGLFPTRSAALRNPVLGAQAVGWRRSLWRKVRKHSMLLMRHSSLTTDRFLRAVLLEDKATGLACWHGSTHFVVGGDRARDNRLERDAMKTCLKNLHTFLGLLTGYGHPVIFELDANIHHDSEAWIALKAIVTQHGGTFHGELGVEYLFTIPGSRCDVVVEDTWTIPTKVLFTDHEGRGITYHLVRR